MSRQATHTTAIHSTTIYPPPGDKTDLFRTKSFLACLDIWFSLHHSIRYSTLKPRKPSSNTLTYTLKMADGASIELAHTRLS